MGVCYGDGDVAGMGIAVVGMLRVVDVADEIDTGLQG